MTRSGTWARVGLPVLGLASLIALWQLVSLAGLVSQSSVPRPLAVAKGIGTLFGDADFRSGVVDTLQTWVETVALGTAVAVAAGLIASGVPFLRRPVNVVVDTFRSVPATALIPIGIVFFGLGPRMKIAIALYAIFWPILINTVYGVASTEPMRIDAARSLRWSWWRRQAFVMLPSALPSILTGIRIAAGIALIVIISTELLGANSGVGTVLVQYSQASRPDVVYAGIFVLGVAGAILFGLLVRLERRLVRWGAVV